MVTRGNVNTACITRYRSYEAAIGEKGEGGGLLRNHRLIFFFFYTDTSSQQQILTHLHPQ